jgi:hypothetical protein
MVHHDYRIGDSWQNLHPGFTLGASQRPNNRFHYNELPGGFQGVFWVAIRFANGLPHLDAELARENIRQSKLGN